MATQTVLLYLHSANPPIASWVVFDEFQTVLQTTLRADLTTFVNAEGQTVIAILPAHDILILSAELPKMKRKQLESALPFALEEQLIDDLSTLHFALGEYQPENLWPVAVITHTKMAEYLECLKTHHIFPNTVIPITLAMPYTENHWAIFCLDGFCFVRTGSYSGFGSEFENLNTYIDLKLAEVSQKPEQIDLYAETDPKLSIPTLTYHKASDKQLFESLLRGIKTHPSIDLQQGVFHTKHKLGESRKFWRYAAYITVAWLGLGLISNLLSFMVLQAREKSAEHQIAEIYQRNFPNATSVSSPKERMESKLNKLSTQESNQSFLVLLAHTGAAFSQAKGVRLQNMNFRERQLALEVSANSFDDLDNFMRQLEQQKLTAKQQNAEAIAGRVKATIQINVGAA